jgi:hypothetical protein
METSITTRVAASITADFVTFGALNLIADYAHPAAPAARVAIAAR